MLLRALKVLAICSGGVLSQIWNVRRDGDTGSATVISADGVESFSTTRLDLVMI